MKVNVENIKVLKVENNGKIEIFKCDDIISLEYQSVSIEGRIAKIADTEVTVDCSTMYNSQIHEVSVIDIENIVKVVDHEQQKNEKTTLIVSAMQVEENENRTAEGNKIVEKEIIKEERALEPILGPKESNTEAKAEEPAQGAQPQAKEETDDSVSLFGNIKRNYAQGISPIFK